MDHDEERVKKLKLPTDLKMKSLSGIAALYRFISTHASKSPRKQWALMTKKSFSDSSLFEEAKVNWLKGVHSFIDQNKFTTQITTEVLATFIRKASKNLDIKFSKSMINLAIKEIPKGIPQLKSLNQIWYKLVTDPLRKIPMTWNKAMKEAYKRECYPARGFYAPEIPPEWKQDYLDVSSNPLPTPMEMSPPTIVEKCKAQNTLLDSLATDVPATKIPLDKHPEELDWLTRYHVNRKIFKSKLEEATWSLIEPTFLKWKASYPHEPFQNLVHRLFPHLREAAIDSPIDISSTSLFTRDKAPQTEKEWMRLFSTKLIHLPNSHHRDEIHALQANYTNLIDLNLLKTITPAGFQRGGRLSHIFVDRQNRLPGEVYFQLKIKYPEIPDLYQIIWR